MVKVRYIGPHASVDLPLETGEVWQVPRGADVDVPAAVRDNLVRQKANWEEVKEKPAPKKDDDKK